MDALNLLTQFKINDIEPKRMFVNLFGEFSPLCGNTRNMLHKKCKTYCFLAGYCLCSCVNSSHAIVCIAFVFRYVHRNRIPIGVYNLVCNKQKSLKRLLSCGIDSILRGQLEFRSFVLQQTLFNGLSDLTCSKSQI